MHSTVISRIIFPTSFDLFMFNISFPTEMVFSNFLEKFPTSVRTFKLHSFRPHFQLSSYLYPHLRLPMQALMSWCSTVVSVWWCGIGDLLWCNLVQPSKRTKKNCEKKFSKIFLVKTAELTSSKSVEHVGVVGTISK